MRVGRRYGGSAGNGSGKYGRGVGVCSDSGKLGRGSDQVQREDVGHRKIGRGCIGQPGARWRGRGEKRAMDRWGGDGGVNSDRGVKSDRGIDSEGGVKLDGRFKSDGGVNSGGGFDSAGVVNLDGGFKLDGGFDLDNHGRVQNGCGAECRRCCEDVRKEWKP